MRVQVPRQVLASLPLEQAKVLPAPWVMSWVLAQPEPPVLPRELRLYPSNPTVFLTPCRSV